MILEEEDEDELNDDIEVEEVDHFGVEHLNPSDLETAVDDHDGTYTGDVSPLAPLTPVPPAENEQGKRSASGGVPLTAHALAKMQEEEEEKEEGTRL